LWTPVELPHHSNNHTPWPQTCQATYVLCGQHASLQLPTDQIRPLLEALQKRLQIDSSNPELAINEILASHADPKYNDWKLVIMENTGWCCPSTASSNHPSRKEGVRVLPHYPSA